MKVAHLSPLQLSGWTSESRGPPPPSGLRSVPNATYAMLYWRPVVEESGGGEGGGGKSKAAVTATRLEEAARYADEKGRKRGSKADPSAYTYRIAYGPASGLVSFSPTWSYVERKGGGYGAVKLTGLYESTSYVVQIQTVGPDGKEGEWSPRITFSTLSTKEAGQAYAKAAAKPRGGASGGGGEEGEAKHHPDPSSSTTTTTSTTTSPTSSSSSPLTLSTTAEEWEARKQRELQLLRDLAATAPRGSKVAKRAGEMLGKEVEGEGEVEGGGGGEVGEGVGEGEGEGEDEKEREIRELKERLAVSEKALESLREDRDGVLERLAEAQKEQERLKEAADGEGKEAEKAKDLLEGNAEVVASLLDELRTQRTTIDALSGAGPNPALEAKLVEEGFRRDNVRFFLVVVGDTDEEIRPYLERIAAVRTAMPHAPDEAIRHALVQLENSPHDEEVEKEVGAWIERHRK